MNLSSVVVRGCLIPEKIPAMEWDTQVTGLGGSSGFVDIPPPIPCSYIILVFHMLDVPSFL